MKKLIWSFLTVAAVTLFAVAGQAQAALNYDTAYMVRADNSHVLSIDASNNYVYNAGETPWAYIKFQLSTLSLASPLHMHWVWSSNTDPNIFEFKDQNISLTGLIGDKELWLSAPQPWWTNNGGPGTWHVDVNWFNVKGTDGISAADFTVCGNGGGVQQFSSVKCGPVVTPEPISSALFLLGGVPLIGAIRRKQKTV